MVAALLLCCVLGADEKEAAEALARFSVEFKSKDIEVRVAAVTALAQVQHEKVHSKLAGLLLTDAPEIRISAAQGLAGGQENRKKVTVYLTNGFLANQNDLKVEAAIIDALEKLKPGLGRATLENIIRTAEIETAKIAIQTAGECRKKDLVESLIALYQALDARAKEYQTAGPRARGYVGRGLPGDPGPTVDPEAPKRARALDPVFNQVLYGLTGEKLASSREWADWWKKNGAGFTLP